MAKNTLITKHNKKHSINHRWEEELPSGNIWKNGAYNSKKQYTDTNSISKLENHKTTSDSLDIKERE